MDGRILCNADRVTRAESTTNGGLLWSYAKRGGTFGPGSGNGKPTLHNGLLYVPSAYGQSASTTIVLDPSTGNLVRILRRSDPAIAFDGSVGILSRTDVNSPSVISAVNFTIGAVYELFPTRGPGTDRTALQVGCGNWARLDPRRPAQRNTRTPGSAGRGHRQTQQ